MKLKRIDHIGVIATDAAAVGFLLETSLGLTLEETTERPDLKAAFYGCDDTRIEVIEVVDPEERRARIRDDDVRIEHIAFEVEDLDQTLRALEALGIELKGPPRAGSTLRSAFTVAATSGGIMLQFCERL